VKREHIETIETMIQQLSEMIATLQQATVIGERPQKELAACELLKDARLKLIEELEAQS
jgi:hypothetical protein